MPGFFTPRVPAVAVIDGLRDFCDQTAVSTLSMLIEREVFAVDLVLSADQKQHFLDLWASTVFELGAAGRDGSTQKLCVAAARAATSNDPRQRDIQATAKSIVREPREVDGWSSRIVANVMAQAFGSETFDQEKVLVTPAATNLSMCVRFAAHLMKTNKVSF